MWRASSYRGVHVVESDDVCSCEESVHEETDDTTDGVLSEQIERIVNAEQELDCTCPSKCILSLAKAEHKQKKIIERTFSRIITHCPAQNTRNHAPPRRNKPRRRRRRDQPRNRPRTKPNHAILPLIPKIEQAPDHAPKRGGQHRVPDGVDGAEIGTEGGAAVEPEPAEPEDEGAEADEGDVVRAEVEEFFFATATEAPGVCESCDAAADLDGSATYSKFELIVCAVQV